MSIAVCFLVVTILSVVRASSHAIFDFEKVGGDPRLKKERLILRANASSLKTLHVYRGDIITINICLNQTTEITVDNIFYSNDGGMDLIFLLMNDKYFASFYSKGHGDWGRMWNKIESSGNMGGPIKLSSGNHTMSITVQNTDCYGVELDAMNIRTQPRVDTHNFFCGSRFYKTDTIPDCNEQFNPPPTTTLIFDPPTTTTQSTTTSTQPPTTTTTTTTMKTTTVTTTVASTSSTQTTLRSTIEDKVISIPENIRKSTFPPSTKMSKQVTLRQKSFDTECLDFSNVRMDFSRPDLTGVTITAVSGAVKDHGKRHNEQHSKTTCKSTIWQIGKVDGSQDEFDNQTPIFRYDYHLYIAEGVVDASKIPGRITANRTVLLTITYTLPTGVDFEDNSEFHFALGLSYMKSTTLIGMQYYDKRRRVFSKLYALMFSPDRKVMGWSIPASSISPLQENQIRVVFHIMDPPVVFDFLRLDFEKTSFRKRTILHYHDSNFRIKSLQYLDRPDKKAPSGMAVRINSNLPILKLEKFIILYRNGPNDKYSNILSIHANGKLYPYAPYNSMSTSEFNGKALADVSGFTFHGAYSPPGINRDVEHAINQVHVDLSTRVINIMYKDMSLLKLSFSTTETETQLFVSQANFTAAGLPPRVTFTSTFVNDYIAAVSELAIDGQDSIPIFYNMDGRRGHVFTFKKGSHTVLYRTPSVLELRFP